MCYVGINLLYQQSIRLAGDSNQGLTSIQKDAFRVQLGDARTAGLCRHPSKLWQKKVLKNLKISVRADLNTLDYQNFRTKK